MAKRSGTKAVNGFLLDLLIERGGFRRSHFYGDKTISRGGLDNMLGNKPCDVEKIKAVADKLKAKYETLIVEDLFLENGRKFEQIVNRGQRRDHTQVNTHPWVEIHKQSMMEQLDVTLDLRSSEMQPHHPVREEADDRSTEANLYFPGRMDVLKDRQEAKRRMGILYDRLATISIELGEVMTEIKILAAKWGSIVITISMGEDDAVRMIDAFVRGYLDDIGLFRIDFTQLTPKLVVAISRAERASKATRIMRKRGILRSSATLTRELASRSTVVETPAAPPNKPSPSNVRLESPVRRWGRKGRAGLIPSDQIGNQKSGRSKLLDYAVVVACSLLMCIMLISAVSSAREKAARLHCANNLKQIGIATHNYVGTHGCLPPGALTQLNPITNKFTPGFSCFVRMLPYLEQQSMFDGVNFSLTELNIENITVAGFNLSVLNCPSDPKEAVRIDGSFGISPMPKTGNYNARHASYAGCQGVFPLKNFDGISKGSPNDRRNYNVIFLDGYLGLIFPNSIMTFADIVDGTSNTFLIGEHSKSLLAKHSEFDSKPRFSWHSGYYLDTQFSTMYPPNIQNSMKTGPRSTAAGRNFPASATSNHSNGANFLFGDGSVRFITNSINSWSFAAGHKDAIGNALPDSMTYNPTTKMYTDPVGQLGAYQALSTRDLGEIVPYDPSTMQNPY